MEKRKSIKSSSDENARIPTRHTALSTARKQRKTRKIILLGSAKCGKTSFLDRLIKRTFTTYYHPTVEHYTNHDYKYKGFNLNLDFIDMCGPFSFPSMRNLNIKSADAVLLFYEISVTSNIKEALACLEIIKELRENERLPIILIGTKKDLHIEKTEEECHEEIQELKDSFEGLKHILTSAKFDHHIQDALELALDEFIARIHSLSLSSYYMEKNDKKCCIS